MLKIPFFAGLARWISSANIATGLRRFLDASQKKVA
jgi:hypothetical protein